MPTLPLRPYVFVVWPPVWNAFDLHVAVPALCGYLAQEGVPLRQFDLNIDFFRHLVLEETLENPMAGTPPDSLPPHVREAWTFVQQFHRVEHSPLPRGYRQRFSNDAEALLLSNALTVFNHLHAPTTFTTLGVYQAEDTEDSDFVAELAARDLGNPFATFFRQAFIPDLVDQLPRIVGISISGGFQLAAGLTLARLVKEVDPRIRVVVGGAFFSTLPEVLLAPKTAANLFRHVDAFIFNEGELPFHRLIRDVLAGQPPQAGPNVLLPGQNGLAYEPSLCLPPQEIAPPIFAEGAVAKYFRPVPRIPIEVSRGCYWGKCSFCNLATGANERYRGLPVERILENLEKLTKRHGVSEVMFSTLAMAPKVLQGVARGLLDSPLKVGWSSWIRPEKTLSEDRTDLFRRAGCTSLAVAPESFSQNTLRRMRKGLDAPQLIRTVRNVQRAGLCGPINIIPGFPGETEEDFLATVEVCRELGLTGEFFPFHLLKNSPIYRHPESFGIVLREDPRKDLAVSIPFESTHGEAAPSGLELIHLAAQRYPGQVSASDHLAGYTFDFSAP